MEGLSCTLPVLDLRRSDADQRIELASVGVVRVFRRVFALAHPYCIARSMRRRRTQFRLSGALVLVCVLLLQHWIVDGPCAQDALSADLLPPMRHSNGWVFTLAGQSSSVRRFVSAERAAEVFAEAVSEHPTSQRATSEIAPALLAGLLMISCCMCGARAAKAEQTISATRVQETAVAPSIAPAATKTPRKSTFLDMIFNLRDEEAEVEKEEKAVDEELKKEVAASPFNLLEEARLLNLRATLRAEESVIKAEEKDVEFRSGPAFTKDAQKLGSLERIESELRFDSEENAELNAIQKLLPK